MEVTFETAALADAVQRAARIAPTKGSALDKCAGVLFEINNPANPDGKVVIKSTDETVQYRQKVSPMACDDDEVSWRLSSGLISGFLGGLSMASGSTVTFKDTGDGWVYVKADSAKAKIAPITMPGFPIIDYEPSASGWPSVVDFSRRLRQVEWSTKKKASELLGGVHMDGEHLAATDGYTLARVPCKINIVEPITAPMSSLAILLKDSGDVRMSADGQRLYVSNDPDTVASTLLIAGKYPDVGRLFDMAATYPHKVVIERDHLVTAIKRMLVLAADDRSTPLTSLRIEGNIVRVSMEVPQVGMMTEDIELTGQAEPFRFFVTPNLMTNALDASNRAMITLSYGNDPKASVRLSDDDDYVALVMPRVP